MTVTYLGEDPGGRKANNTLGVRTYTRVFKFETSSQSEDAWDVGSHANAPRIGDVFHDAWCKSVSPDNNNPWKGWIITAEYSSERELATDPTHDPAIVRVTTEQFQREATHDRLDNLICNSAGDPLDPPLMMDDSRRVIHISKNMSGHPSWILDYADMVNSDTFTVKGVTYGIGTGKIQRVSIGEQQVRNGVPFVVVDIEIQLRREGWLVDRLDQGFREVAYGGMVNIRNSGDDELPASPVPLENGVAIANPSAAVNILLELDVYNVGSFSSIPFT